jgi:hypothetical protein
MLRKIDFIAISFQNTDNKVMQYKRGKHNHLAICELGKAGCLAITMSQLEDGANCKAFSSAPSLASTTSI